MEERHVVGVDNKISNTMIVLGELHEGEGAQGKAGVVWSWESHHHAWERGIRRTGMRQTTLEVKNLRP